MHALLCYRFGVFEKKKKRVPCCRILFSLKTFLIPFQDMRSTNNNEKKIDRIHQE
jgi:hypothetical protein